MPAFSDSEFNSLAEKIASYVPSKSYAIPYLMSRHKQASVMNVPLNVNNLSERARLIILIKSLLDPATRCIIEEVTKDPRVLRSLREKNLYQQDLKQELLPLYDFSVRPSHFDKFYGG
jgi:hypothetical protein